MYIYMYIWMYKCLINYFFKKKIGENYDFIVGLLTKNEGENEMGLGTGTSLTK